MNVRINRRAFLKNAAIGAGAVAAPWAVHAASDAKAAQRPNILIIFTDDQGYGDLGCYSQDKIDTPRMDKLAQEGTRFTSFYAQTVCGPSRSALLTGRYPVRSKGWSMPAGEITFAERMRKVGYQTACIGKWDVSNRKPIIDRMPNAQGFDYYFGPLGANDNGKVTLYKNNERLRTTDDMAGITHLYTQKAIDYLKNKHDTDKPFVLYLAHTMLHMNIDASKRFKGKSEYGLYGDAVEELDYETGRLLDVLDELGLTKDTLVIFTTDNGPWNQKAYIKAKRAGRRGTTSPMYEDAVFWGDPGPLRNGKGSCYEGGSRVPCIVRWPGKVPAGRVSDAIFATIDFMPTFANLAGFDVPDDRVIDGIDQTDLLMGKSGKGRQTYLYERGNGIRKGKWKYLKARHKVPGYAVDKDRKQVEELYDLQADISETNNLAEKYPEKVRELKDLMEKIIKKKR